MSHPSMLNEENKIRDLELEILRLQTKLRDSHLSDSNADRRALVTLHQHIEALQRECQGISDNIAGLDMDLVGQSVVEEELGSLSIVALSTYLADRVVKASKMLDSKQVRGVVWTLSGTYVVWRISVGFWRKLQSRVKNNVNQKSQLEYRYEKVASRIEVMGQLLPEMPSNGAALEDNLH